MESNSNKRGIFIILGILVLVCLVIFLILPMLKSDEVKFVELLLKKQSITELAGDWEKNGETIRTIEMNEDAIAELMGEEVEFKYVIDSTRKNENFSGSVDVLIDNDEVMSLQYAKTGDVFGVKMEEVTDEYIAIRNEELKKVLKKFDVDEDDFPERILLKEDFEKVMELNPDKLEKIANKYIKIMSKGLKDRIEVEKNVEMKFGDNKIKTKKYTLEITEKVLFDIIEPALKELKEDEKNIKLVLDDTKAVLELMEENNYPVEDMFDCSSRDVPSVDEVVEAVNEAYDYLTEYSEEEGLNEEDVYFTLSVYEYKGKTVATEFIVDGDDEYIVKTLIGKDLYVAIEYSESGETYFSYALEGTIEDGKNIDAELSVEMLGETKDVATIKREFNNSTKNFIKINDENSFILNDKSKKEIENKFEELVENYEDLEEKINEKMEGKYGGNSIFGNSNETISNANFSSFAQEFGDFSFNFQVGPLADVQVKYGVSEILSRSQQIWLASSEERENAYDDNKEILSGITVPAGKSFKTAIGTLYNADGTINTYTLADDIACYDLDIENVSGYMRGTFYGDNYGQERYFVTEMGTVFTLPGFPRTVDKENRFYITPNLYYLADKDYAWDAAVLSMDSEIVETTGNGARNVRTTIVEGDVDISESIEIK